MAANLSGNVTVVTASGTITWGKPSASAAKVAVVVGNSAEVVIFGYDTGASMVGLNAPARRVGLYMFDTTAAGFTSSGAALFDAAINWATGLAPLP